MQRRLDLAGALVARPPVLFLDEPTTGLDPRSRTEMWSLLQELVSGGTTLLLTTQYLEEADLLADNIVVIDHGRVIAEGTADAAEVAGRRRAARDHRLRRRPRAGHAVGARAAGGRRGRRPTTERRTVVVPVSGGAAVLADALRRLDAEGVAARRRRAAPAHARRRVPVPHRPRGRGRARGPRRPRSDERHRHRVSDAFVVAKRNLIKIKRVPDLLVFTTLSPIMFILLFAYVFGGAIDEENGGDALPRVPDRRASSCRPSIFGATITGYGLAEDVKKGIIDRFRSLPMSPSAVLAGRTISDVVNNVITLVVMSLTGLLVGWRIRDGALEALWAYVLLLVFAYAISWIMAWIGMLVPSPEVVNNASFMVIFPLTFIANTFVPLETLPGPLQTFAEWNPVSSVTQAARELFGNTNPIAGRSRPRGRSSTPSSTP